MNIISDIIANAIDLAGGTNPLVSIQTNAATLYALNVLADMELELSCSARGRSSQLLKSSYFFDSRNGTLERLPEFIRFRSGNNSRWQVIDIVSDIEDLTAAEENNRRAILFFGDSPAYHYQLSFEPEYYLEAQLWGTSEGSDAGTLNDAAAIPSEYTHLAATRIALLLLDDLLLAQNGQALIPFVQSRKQMLAARERDLKHRWTVYRSNADNSLSDAQTFAYDPFDDLDTLFEIR